MKTTKTQRSYTIGPHRHPPVGIMGGSVHKYERSTSPWHKDKFPDAFKASAPEQGETPSSGWMALDWCGNPIGFFHDGMEFPGVEYISQEVQ